MTTNQLVNYYRLCASIRQTADYFKISPQKCRRLLIAAGEYSTPLSAKISSLYEQGLPIEKIADQLNMRRETVQAYIPYSKGSYHADTPTKNALAIRRHRAARKECNND